MRREGTYTLESKLDLFDRLRNGVMTLDGITYVKVTKYSMEGFTAKLKTPVTLIAEENGQLVEQKSEGTFAFARFEDKFSASKTYIGMGFKYTTYIPIDTMVYTRNQVVDKRTLEPLTEKIHNELNANWYVLMPLSFVIERAEQLEEYIEDIRGYDYDGLTHSRYSHIQACEVFLPEETIIDINTVSPVFLQSHNDYSTQINMYNSKVVYELLNKYVLKLIDKYDKNFQVTHLEGDFYELFLRPDTFISFHLVDKQIVILDCKTAFKEFIEEVEHFLELLSKDGYTFTVSDTFLPTMSERYNKLGKPVTFNISSIGMNNRIGYTQASDEIAATVEEVEAMAEGMGVIKLDKIYVKFLLEGDLKVITVHGDAEDFVKEFQPFVSKMVSLGFTVNTTSMKLVGLN